MRLLPILIFVPWLLSSCGDDSSSTGGGATGGAAGQAGSGGSTAGSGGEGGEGGTGESGAGGLSGTGGTDAGGTGGATAGTGGVGGTAGTGGVGGTAGTGGVGGTAGTGGVGGTGGGSLFGHVVYRTEDTVYIVEATQGAQPTSVSAVLDGISAGIDEDANLSPDGAWLSLVTSRFGCDDWSCAVIMDVGLSQPTVVATAGGERIHPDEAVAIGSGGDVLVFADTGVHQRDLLVMRKTGSTWTAPVNITQASTFNYNTQPAIADDGHAVVFDCSPVPYGGSGTKVCEVDIDGTGFHVLVDPANSPNGQSGNRVHSADYAPDGSIVFEGEWGQEQIWRLSPGSSTPTVVGSFNNDNTPCVLPDGWVASLWLNAPGNPSGYHEVKVMNANGSEYSMLVQGMDIHDSTVGCGH